MEQIGFFSKVKRAWSRGNLWSISRRVLITKFRRPFDGILGYIHLSKTDRNLDVANGFADHRHKKHHHRTNPEHISRILIAYKASKQAQLKAIVPFQIRGLWDGWISYNYKKLITALEAERISDLSDIFENLYREQFTVGMGGYEFYLRYRMPLSSMYIKYVWASYRDKLLKLDFDLHKISFPLIGNPTGIVSNGNVIPSETLRHAYHAIEMNELLRDVPIASIVEIGGGIGGQAYQTIQMRGEQISKYIVFDIPEVAAISSYFLLSAFPNKRVRLFGEGSVSIASGEDYDLAIFPHFSITQLPDLSVDLFYNSCSFSEMDGITSREYLSIIERTCRRYLLHDNHDTVLKFSNPDGSTSVNVVGSKLVPDTTLFKRIFKKPRVYGLPEDKCHIQFEYLYEKI